VEYIIAGQLELTSKPFGGQQMGSRTSDKQPFTLDGTFDQANFPEFLGSSSGDIIRVYNVMMHANALCKNRCCEQGPLQQD
jgi:hypothetical protein